MPIVNGSYVPDILGTPQQAQSAAFGNNYYTSKDMSDYSQAAYNYLMKQQENAYNLELWHLSNEYNSPTSQMLRFQEAGLNPNLIYSQQNQSSTPNAGAATTFRSSGYQNKRVQTQLNTIAQMQSLLEQAASMYDTFRYGIPAHRRENDILSNRILQSQSEAQLKHYEQIWNEYLLGLTPGFDSDHPLSKESLASSPRGQMQKTQQDLKAEEYERLKFMVSSLLPSQEARNSALTELDRYQKQIMEGKFDVALNIQTGLGDKVDQIVRLIMLMGLAKMF